ncbi:hypothetical protein D1012_13330 [Pseudotabrizicola alkalilacus]|uniref:Uncharacterized protein n=1 Tax=Pseudotabrizicola alkalilacus TaxID=2305252 RepID=A0A411Z0S0_9RHOB|nr:hypothetical protein D1012_13330 [Pseudotabrizicola alkalilacus]
MAMSPAGVFGKGASHGVRGGPGCAIQESGASAAMSGAAAQLSAGFAARSWLEFETDPANGQSAEQTLQAVFP